MRHRKVPAVAVAVGATVAAIVSLTSAVTATAGTAAARRDAGRPTAVSAEAPPPAYTPLSPPERILDTRRGLGAPARRIKARKSVSVRITGVGAIPAGDVDAVTLSVSAVAPLAPTSLTVYPAGMSRPTATNLTAATSGTTVTTTTVVKVPTGGRIRVHSTAGATHVTAAVTGYWPTGSFGAIAPGRLANTRTGYGTPKKPLGPGKALTLTVTGRRGVPELSTDAVALAVTAVGPSAPTTLRVYTQGTSRPSPATLVAPTRGRSVTALAVVPLGESEQVVVRNESGRTDVTVDVLGYWPDTLTPTYLPVPPTPVLDTRGTGPRTGAPAAVLPARGTIDLLVAGTAGVPTRNVRAVAVHVTAVAPRGATTLVAHPTGGTSEVASVSAPLAGRDSDNLVVVPLSEDGKITIRSTAADTDVTVDVVGCFTDPLHVATTSLPPAAAGQPYGVALAAAAGTAPYTWGISPGSALPPGLRLAADGSLSGTPTDVGTSTFGVTVVDANGGTAQASLELTVSAGPTTGP